MAEERSFLYALGDNVIGFEDDHDSLGERGPVRYGKILSVFYQPLLLL